MSRQSCHPNYWSPVDGHHLFQCMIKYHQEQDKHLYTKEDFEIHFKSMTIDTKTEFSFGIWSMISDHQILMASYFGKWLKPALLPPIVFTMTSLWNTIGFTKVTVTVGTFVDPDQDVKTEISNIFCSLALLVFAIAILVSPCQTRLSA